MGDVRAMPSNCPAPCTTPDMCREEEGCLLGYAMPAPRCPRGCASWDGCDEPGPDCSATNRPDETGERFGVSVCSRGDCIEPCGDYGGCKR